MELDFNVTVEYVLVVNSSFINYSFLLISSFPQKEISNNYLKFLNWSLLNNLVKIFINKSPFIKLITNATTTEISTIYIRNNTAGKSKNYLCKTFPFGFSFFNLFFSLIYVSSIFFNFKF